MTIEDLTTAEEEAALFLQKIEAANEKIKGYRASGKKGSYLDNYISIEVGKIRHAAYSLRYTLA